MLRRLLLASGLASAFIIATIIFAGLTVGRYSGRPSAPSQSSSVEAASPAHANTAQVELNDAVAAAENDPPATKHAGDEVLLALEHKGDSFPLDMSYGSGPAEFAAGQDAEAEADRISSANARPDGSDSEDGITRNFRAQAYDARFAGRLEVTADAISAALSEEPGAWQMKANFLDSGITKIYVAGGPSCVELSDAMASGKLLGCSSIDSLAKNKIWSAFQTWKNLRSG